MPIRILHTNDFHGHLTGDKVDALRKLRTNADLYFDTGDCIKAGNLAFPLRADPVWPILASLQCQASVLGNRETHVLESAFNRKLEGATHPLMAGNLRRRDGSRPLKTILETMVGGVRVGVLAVMVPMVTERMATQAASAYLWDQPIPTAIELARQLRARVDLVIALTHIGVTLDRKLADECPEIDIILGGHSHTVLEHPERVGRTWICHGGSHGRYAGLYSWDPESRTLEGGLAQLPNSLRRTGR